MRGNFRQRSASRHPGFDNVAKFGLKLGGSFGGRAGCQPFRNFGVSALRRGQDLLGSWGMNISVFG